jgi:hypothetical protein
MVTGVECQYRVWIVRYVGWQPQNWRDVPAQAVAVEPAEVAPMSAEVAGHYVEGFNLIALSEPSGHWAVAVPVRLRYEGDLSAGQALLGLQTCEQ